MIAGEVCKTGLAFIRNSTTAVCAEISHVTTNLDNFVERQTKGPFKCSLNRTYTQPSGCRYHFVDEKGISGVISEEYCECSMNSTLNEQGIGYCPYPNQDLFQKYTDSLKKALASSQCHTNDWNNFLAQMECGVGSDNTTVSIWNDLVDSSFNITYYPYIQEGGNYQCL